MLLEIKEMAERHSSQTTIWSKGQSKVVATMKEEHNEENQEHQKQIDNLIRVNSSVESENAQSKRDLQSCQQRCSSLEKLLGSLGNDHKNTVDKLLQKVTETETQVEASHFVERALQ